MPWTRNEPDPLRARKLQLAEQERALAERMSRLTEELRNGGKPLEAGKAMPSEPPIWRLEDEAVSRRMPELASARRRDLARQRRRDRFVFFFCMAALVVAAIIFMWLWRMHLHPDS